MRTAGKQEDGEGGAQDVKDDTDKQDDAEGVAEIKGKEKRKKKKPSKGEGEAETEAPDEAEGGEELTTQGQLMNILRRNRTCDDSRRQPDRAHLFWDTQPVPSMSSENFQDSDNGPIDPIKTPADVKDEGYSLPDAFQWHTCDVNDDSEIRDIYTLLCENYVEDDDSMFRFDYSEDFLRWALLPPGYIKSWHLGVRVKSSQKLVGFITGIPANMQVFDTRRRMVEINFLCV